MAKMKINGLDEYAKKLSKLNAQSAEACMKHAVYSGAGLVADAIRANIQALPEFTGSWQNYKEPIYGVSTTQKQGLLKGLGTSEIMNDSGYVNTKISFAGYNDHVTEKYPQGQPNILVARSLESGSSIGDKIPFVRPAVSRTRTAAIKIMAIKADEFFENIMEG